MDINALDKILEELDRIIEAIKKDNLSNAYEKSLCLHGLYAAKDIVKKYKY